MLFAGSSCSDSPDPTPPSLLPDGAFTITLSDITYSSVKIAVTAENKTQTYYSHILAKKDFAKNWNSSASALLTDYIAFLCEEYEMSKKEVVAELISTGNTTWDYNRLEPSTEYVVFAVGLDAEGVLTTNPVMKEFTAPTLPTVVPVECTFDIRVSNITATRALIDITPSNNQVPYFYDLVPVSLYPSGDATEFLTDFVREAAYSVMDQTGSSFKEAVALLAALDVSGLDLTPGTLRPSTEYYVVAFGIDVYGRPTTTPKTQKFATPAIVPSSNTFTIEVEDVTATNALVSIAPSNNDPYYVNYFRKAELAGRTDEEILTAIQSQGIIQATNTSVYLLDAADRLFPCTEYEILVFGYDEGVTTAITRKSFTTLVGGDPSQCEFEIDFFGESGSVLVGVYPSDESVFYFLDVIQKSAYPTDAKLIADIESDLKNQSRDTGMPIQDVMLDFCYRGITEQNFQVESLQEYVIAVFALNMNGTAAGPVYKNDYTSEEVVVSSARAEVKVLKYFSGPELYNYNPLKYAEGSDNLAYLLTEVTHTEDAVRWYASVFADDLSEASDKNIIRNLVDNQGGEVNVDRLEVWVWGYFFDVAYYGRDGIPNTLCAVAIDAEGNYGPVFKELYKPVTTGVSPISELTNTKVAATKRQQPHLFKKEQPTMLPNRLIKRVESENNTHLIFTAPAARTQATPVVCLQTTKDLQNTGGTSRMFGHGKTFCME